MNKYFLYFFLFLIPVLGLGLDLKGHWALEKSEITYTVTHPLHVVKGKAVSPIKVTKGNGANAVIELTFPTKGKGVCYSGHNEFHVGVLVDSFDSGDKNRDLHMLQVTKAGLYPLIDVKADFKEKDGRISLPGQVAADFTIQFAGKTVKYPNVNLEMTAWNSGGAHLLATLRLKLRDFEIQPPSLLTMPVQDEVPVRLDMFWKHVDSKELKK